LPLPLAVYVWMAHKFLTWEYISIWKISRTLDYKMCYWIFSIFDQNNSAVLQPNIQWSQNFHPKFISLYPPNSCFISMEHDGIGNSPALSYFFFVETFHRNKYRTGRQTQNKTIWHSQLTLPYLYFTSCYMLHNCWTSKKKYLHK
jgi:hypothetical protein